MSVTSVLAGLRRGRGRGDGPMTPSTAAAPARPASPFFAPSSRTPVVHTIAVTPGGTRRLRRRKDKSEAKSTVTGASFNLINAIVGAGIVGIPYAIRQTGLVSGMLTLILCAALNAHSLRLLIETARHVGVGSYETLLEASFGGFGFYFMGMTMLTNAYGTMVAYLIVIRQTLPPLLGYGTDDYYMARVLLSVSTLLVIFPLSMQRDIAALAKTSTVSVTFDLVMVAIVVAVSPIRKSVEAAGGIRALVEGSTFRPDTFFVGVGVLSFAFVCQHASFIIAGSLERPTKKRWGTVTGNASGFCCCLAALCGAMGYLGYLDGTAGNIVSNLGASPYDAVGGATQRLALLAKALMCTCMFLVYPIELFVARHVLIVLFFSGRRAHDGDDHAVLARPDRLLALTAFIYAASLVPALVVESLGPVLAISGSIGGSSLSYICPGASYLAVHGREFLELVQRRWGGPGEEEEEKEEKEVDGAGGGGIAATGSSHGTESLPVPAAPILQSHWDRALWYLALMPVWCGIATVGMGYVERHKREEALKSPHVGRLGRTSGRAERPPRPFRAIEEGEDGDNGDGGGEAARLLRRADSLPKTAPSGHIRHPSLGRYGAAASPTGGMGDRGIAQAIAAAAAAAAAEEDVATSNDDDEDGGPEHYVPPSAYDYAVAIFLFVFGLVAAGAGTYSTLVQ